MRDRGSGSGEAGLPRVRLDKWLWAARFYKTRSQSSEAIHAGHVKSRGNNLKAGHGVAVGHRIEITKDGVTWEIDVIGVSERRGSGADAQALYQETDAGKQRRAAQLEALRAAAQAAPNLKGRPTKRDRRDRERFVGSGSDE